MIDSAFKHVLGEEPRMGWWTPGRFMAGERHERAYIWSAEPRIVVATYFGAMSSAEHARLTQREHLACDTKGPLAQYSVAATDSLLIRGRAFYTSVAPPTGTQAGLVVRALTPAERGTVHALLAVRDSAVYIDSAFAAPKGRAFYSVDVAYDTAGALLRSALVLHDSLGAIVASQLDSVGFECDGCGPVTADEGLWRVYDVRNVFVVPGFPYPILLLDTSTVEGRALSLVTFMAKGTQLANYRIYEYVVNCIG